MHRMLLGVTSLALLPLLGVAVWLFLYTGDLTGSGHLSQLAPSTQSVVSDSCLAGSSAAVPFERIGEPLKNAVDAAEPARSLPHQIASSLMCNHSGGMGNYHLNAIRLSWDIRMRLSQQPIFTIYVNRAYFGEGMTGVERASQELFHKDPEALGAGEAALLAGLLRGPDLYSPPRHPERSLQRCNKVLEEMLPQGKLSTSEATKLEASQSLFNRNSIQFEDSVATGQSRVMTPSFLRRTWRLQAT